MRDRRTELLALALLLAVGVGLRFLMISRFPTIPVSDFRTLVFFGTYLRDNGLISTGYFWWFLNPGLPLVLCGLFHVARHTDPDAVARIATAFVCGLMPVAPFLLWRGVFPFAARLAAGAALALWPGQILFSGVVAQDNWILLPSVALAALAVRTLKDPKRARPAAAGLLYAATVITRQEMLVALLPLLAAAVYPFGRRWRRAAVAVLAAGLPLVGAAWYRYACTGRFTLSTEHAGASIVGAYAPGSAANGWTDPQPFLASVRPELVGNRRALSAAAARIVWHEIVRRPIYQATRIISSVCTGAAGGEVQSLAFSLRDPEVLSPAKRERGVALADLAARPLLVELAGIHGLFLAAVIIGWRRRSPAVLVLASAVLLKYAVHAVTVMQGRYVLVATAIEILAIVVAACELAAMARVERRALAVRAVVIGVPLGIALMFAAPALAKAVRARDVDGPRTYRFVLRPFLEDDARLSCMMNRGVLTALDTSEPAAAMRTFDADPAAGEEAAAVCELTGTGAPRPVVLRVLDSYAPGGRPDRMVQQVTVDGAAVFEHDIAAEPGSGWAEIPLGAVGAGTRKRVEIEVKAVRPERGAGWGVAGETRFEIAHPK